MSDNLTKKLPRILEGHWNSKEGYEMALTYIDVDKDRLCMGHESSKTIADKLTAVRSTDLNLLPIQTAVKERIRLLSVELALLGKNTADFRKQLPMGDMSDFALANAQFLTSRYDPDLNKIKIAAAARIYWLAEQLK